MKKTVITIEGNLYVDITVQEFNDLHVRLIFLIFYLD